MAGSGQMGTGSTALPEGKEKTMSDFTFHETATAPEAARPILEGAAKKYGFVPNILKGMAEAPALLEGYATLSGIFDKTSFSPVERQVVLLSINYVNNCTYCVAAHSGAAKMAGMDDATLKALREGTKLPDAKLDALSRFTKAVVTERGFVDEKTIKAFLDAGYTRQNVLEVVLAVGFKTLSNYANHIMETPLDSQFKPLEWSKPARAAAE